jgi:hypothetical protein
MISRAGLGSGRAKPAHSLRRQKLRVITWEVTMNRLLALFLLSLMVATLFVAGGSAQSGRTVAPRVVSGSNLGFRVEGVDANRKPYGEWVVKIDGEWIEISKRAQAVPADVRPQ